MYEPPITLTTGEICTRVRDGVDGKILEACQQVDVSLDKPRLLQLLKKDRPEKVVYFNCHGAGYDLSHKDRYHCPTCNRRLRNKQPDPYCPGCGQHLDWEV